MISLIFALLLVANPPRSSESDDAQGKPPSVAIDEATVGKLHEIAFQAAREGDLKTLSAYFEVGQPADVVNARGDSLLILAAYHGQEEAVQIILDQKNVPLDVKNRMGFTALTGAAYKGNLGIVERLVKKGANVNSANSRGQTPLMYAAMFGRAEVVEFLVKNGADAFAKDEKGRTARLLAKAQGNAEVARLLLDAEEKSSQGL